mgnify:FL=1
MSVTGTAENQTLTRAWLFNFEFEHLVNSCAFLPGEGYFVLPQTRRMVFEVLAIRSLESINGRLQLLLELEENVPSEALAQLRELLH